MILSSVAKTKAFLGPEVIKRLWISIVLGLGSFLADTFFVVVVQVFLSSLGAIKPLSDNLTFSIGLSTFLLILYGLIRALIQYASYTIESNTHYAFIKFHRKRLLKFGLENADKIDVHQLINIFNERVNQSGIVVKNLPLLISTTIACMLLVCAGLWIAPLELLSALLVLALLMLPMRILDLKIRTLSPLLAEESKSVNRTLLRGIRNNTFLNIYGLLNNEISRGTSALEMYGNYFSDFHRAQGLKKTLPVFLGTMVISIVAYISTKYQTLSSSEVITFVYLFIRIAQSVSYSGTLISTMRLAKTGVLELQDFNKNLEHLPSHVDCLETVQAVKHPDDVTLKINQLSFCYPQTPLIIKDINLSSKSGEVILIKGKSGSGKSTLLSLIVGTLKPTIGNITFNNLDPVSFKTKYPNVIGYVGPDPYLIPGSIKDNLLYGNQLGNVSDEDCWEALRKAGLIHEIEELSNKLNEVMSEISSLSTGQKQRLAFARALLRNPKVLILDEATANLDDMTEILLLESLTKISSGLVVIVVSHKDSFDKMANVKLIMDRDYE